jgi:hypothetical protein
MYFQENNFYFQLAKAFSEVSCFEEKISGKLIISIKELMQVPLPNSLESTI